MTDERVRHEAHRATTRILTGRLAPTLDPDHVAGLVLDALHDAGLRLVLHQPPIPEGRGKPGDYTRGAEQARELLARRKPGPYRPTEGDQP